jgi:hypothetical protein
MVCARLSLHRIAACGLFACALFGAYAARAHPLGTSSINRYIDFQYMGGGRFRVAYVLDFAEGPAYAEVDALDADHDGAVTPGEQARYLASRLPVLLASCAVDVDGESVAPEVVASHVDAAPGEGGLETLRISVELSVQGRNPADGHELRLHVHDDGFAAVAGWRELHADDATGRDATSLAALATDGGGSPARVLDATFVFAPRAPSVVASSSRLRTAGIAAFALALLVVVGAVVLRRRPV